MEFAWLSMCSEETENFGRLLGGLLRPGDVVCLYGELGAGKTVLAKGIARGLGVAEAVTSPTFTLINEYAGRVPFFHMDAYRLSGPQDMVDLGCEEYFYGEGVTVIEWPERVEEVLPAERLNIYLKVRPEEPGQRELCLVPRGRRYEELLGELKELVCAGH